jgi:Na+-driven multidrug efflux pump
LLAALRVDRGIIRILVAIGLPAGLQIAMIALSEVAVVSLVNAFGSNATAAYGAFTQVVCYVQALAQAAGVAASVFGAHAIGAGQADRLGAVTRVAVMVSILVGTVAVGAVYLFADDILSWFTTDPESQSIARTALAITLWSYLAAGIAGVLAGIMRSSGDVLWPTGIWIAAIWAIQVPAAFLLSRRIGLDGVWTGYPIAFAAALASQCAYYGLIWRHRTYRRLI